ncbi:hypothetical protein [Lacinutrix cladophorae]
MQLFLKRIGVVVLLFVSISMIVSAGSLRSLRQSSFYKPSFLVNSIQEKEFDYIILGASTGLTTLNSKVIDSVLQIKGVNLSMDDTALSSQYLMLQHFLAQGKTTKYCVLAPSIKDYDVINNNLSGNDYRYLPFINSTYVSNYYKQFSSKPAKVLSASKWIPMFGVSYFNAEIFFPSLITLIQSKKRNRFDDKGNYTYPAINNKDKTMDSFKVLPVNFKNIYLEKMKALCTLNNIELICYFSPTKNKRVVTKTPHYNIINHSYILKNETYFYDVIHVNSIGRKVTSELFAIEMKEYIE